MSAMEKYYSIAEAALLLSVSEKTISRRVHDGSFGGEVVDLAKSPEEPNPKSHDYRIPASALNDYLASRRVFSTPGISARNPGELRRRVKLAGNPDV